MRVALLIGANPRLVKSGPLCLLDTRLKWDFVGENIKDTEFDIFTVWQDPTKPESKIVKAIINKPGTESYISIFAESENGNNHG